MKKMKICFSRY